MFSTEPGGLEGLSQKEVAEQLGGQQVIRGRRVSRRAPGAKRTPEGPLGSLGFRHSGAKQPGRRKVTRRMQNFE